MEVITIQSEAFQEILKRIDDLNKKLEEKEKESGLPEKWLNIEETCEFLDISKRTLQTYRDQGTIGFSQFQGKIYFKVADLQNHLLKYYHKAFKK